MQTAALLHEDLNDNITRNSICSNENTILTKVYDTNVNLAIWQRQLSQGVKENIANLLKTSRHLDTSSFIREQCITSDIKNAIKSTALDDAFISNARELVDMFCTLFELKQVGLRLRLLDLPMCPRFHVDKVPCRMVTTFSGPGTQWLEHNQVNRDKLGHGSKGLNDNVSGLFQTQVDIKTIGTGDVALLKGEAWMKNENAGIVHRSPPYQAGQKRLLMTLDFLN
jgi:hypothetical protein